jgi:hypothetical protein
MSAPLAHHAEVLRLARVLGTAPEDLAFLDGVPTDVLAEVRGDVLDRLLARSRDAFERAVALGDRLPRGLAATLAQHAMGPVLGGRAAALLQPHTAEELAARLPPEFLADVAEHVDLRHVGPLVGGIPTPTMAATGAVLREREAWIVLAAFVGHVPRAKLEVLLDGFDGEALLRAGFVLEDVERLDEVVAILSEARLHELLDAAAQHDLWAEAIALAGHLGPQQRARVVAAIGARPPADVDALLATADRTGSWADVLAFTRGVELAGAAGGVAAAVQRVGDAALDRLLAAAAGGGLWAEAVALGAHAPASEHPRILARLAARPAAELDGLAAVLRGDDRLRTAAAPFLAQAPPALLARLDAT